METIAITGDIELRKRLAADATRMSIYTQIERVAPGEDEADEETQRILSAYGAALRTMQRPRGYPRLYRLAWKLLLLAVQRGDWDTLHAIDTVFRVALPDEDVQWVERSTQLVSVFHLKAVLYCWAYLVDSRELGQDSALDAKLLEPQRRRSSPEAAQLLKSLAALQCFVNMTPDEAHQRLEVEAQAMNRQHKRPYLFRASTTIPGAVTLTFLSLASPPRPLDTRVSVQDAMLMSSSTDLYADLVLMRETRDTSLPDQLDANQLARFVQPLFDAQGFDPRRIVAHMPSPALVPRDSVVATLRQIFWPGVQSVQVGPRTTEERLGLTASYNAGYVGAATMGASCFTCRFVEATLEEPLNMQVYCSQKCYARDFDRCY